MRLLRSIFATVSRRFRPDNGARKIDAEHHQQSTATAERLILLSNQLSDRDQLTNSGRSLELFRQAVLEALSTVLYRAAMLVPGSQKREITTTEIEERFKLSLPVDNQWKSRDEELAQELIGFRSLGEIIAEMEVDRNLGVLPPKHDQK